MMKKLLFSLLSMALLAYSFNSLAAGCSLSSGTLTENIDAGNITVQRDAPIGSVLFRKIIPASHETVGTCSEGKFLRQEKTGDLQHPSGNSEIFASGVPGVGIRIRVGKTLQTMTTQQIGSGPATLKDDRVIAISLIKTGPIIPGQLTPRRLLQTKYSGEDKRIILAKEVILNGGVITQASCEVITPTIVVPMGELARNSFKGLSATAGEKEFQIDLNCSKNTNVSVTFSPLAKPKAGVTLKGVLTAEDGESAARGIGIQMLNNGMPVEFNTPIEAGKTSVEGKFSIPLKARYIQTDESVTPGDVNAIASFTMIYQ